jgi:hypothetical protein
MEPPIVDREIAILVESDETWFGQRLPVACGEARHAYKRAFDAQLAVLAGAPSS